MSRKNQQPSMTQIKKILQQSAFDPRIAGPMSVILSQNDPRYFELRAIELITEAQNCLGMSPAPNDVQTQQYQMRMQQAIGLLALAMSKRSKDK